MKTLSKTALIFAGAAMSVGSCLADISIGTGAGLSAGATDTSWVTDATSTALGYPNPVVLGKAFAVGGCGPRFDASGNAITYCWAPDTATSSWVGLTDNYIAPDGAPGQPLGTWSISTTITVGANATLSGVVGFDDYGSLLVNGVAVTLNANGTPITVTNSDNFGILYSFSTALNQGTNTIELDLAPTPGDPSNQGFDGVRLDATANVSATPEPEFYGVLAVGLSGLFLARRLLKRKPIARTLSSLAEES